MNEDQRMNELLDDLRHRSGGRHARRLVDTSVVRQTFERYGRYLLTRGGTGRVGTPSVLIYNQREGFITE